MKLDSKYFDSIRVARREARARRQEPCCEWKGCAAPGLYRAPKGRGNEGQFFLFCMDHVRHYNARYNYFDGMSSVEVDDFRKDALTGHRPTWKMGSGAGLAGARAGTVDSAAPLGIDAKDPHGFFAAREQAARREYAARSRQLRPLERKSLEALALHETATRIEIKARFKELVKRHHPDVNGGDHRSEDRLRDIIQAYNFLKQAGLV